MGTRWRPPRRGGLRVGNAQEELGELRGLNGRHLLISLRGPAQDPPEEGPLDITQERKTRHNGLETGRSGLSVCNASLASPT